MVPNTRKNELLEHVRAAQLAARFSGEDLPSLHAAIPGLTAAGFGEGFQISLSDSPLWFALYHRADSFDYWYCVWTTFGPAYERVVNHPLQWEYVLEWFDLWLSKDVAEFLSEQGAPDLWATAQESAVATYNWTTVPNTPFLPDEQIRISRSIDEMRSTFREMGSANVEFQLFVVERLDALLKESRRMGRKDWIMFAQGSVVTLGTAASVTPGTARALIKAALEALSWLAGGPLLPTGP